MSENTKNTLLVVLGVLLAGAGVIGSIPSMATKPKQDE